MTIDTHPTIANDRYLPILLDEQEIDPDLLMRELEGVGIDCRPDGENGLYVTSLAFNFWLRVDEQRHYLVFNTYAPLVPAEESDGALQFANELNSDKLLIQFFVDLGQLRLTGCYMLSYRGGLLRRQLLRTAILFASIFAEATTYGRRQGLCDALENEAKPPQDKLN